MLSDWGHDRNITEYKPGTNPSTVHMYKVVPKC